MAAGKKKALLLLRQPDLTKASWASTRGKSLQHVAHSSTQALVRSPAASCSILPISPVHFPSQLLLQALWQKGSHVPLCACSQLCQSREKNTTHLFFRGLGFPSSPFNYKWKKEEQPPVGLLLQDKPRSFPCTSSFPSLLSPEPSLHHSRVLTTSDNPREGSSGRNLGCFFLGGNAFAGNHQASPRKRKHCSVKPGLEAEDQMRDLCFLSLPPASSSKASEETWQEGSLYTCFLKAILSLPGSPLI